MQQVLTLFLTMKNILIISTALLISPVLKGQETTNFTNSNVFLEFGGAGFFSANYERILPINEVVRLTGRAGIGVFQKDKGGMFELPSVSPILPLMFNFVYGRSISLEAGLGVTVGFEDYGSKNVNNGLIKWYNGTIGLRYQNPDRGLLIRLGYTPQISNPFICQDSMCREIRRKIGLYNMVGLSVGTRIKSK